jgi:hypothetical protein
MCILKVLMKKMLDYVLIVANKPARIAVYCVLIRFDRRTYGYALFG